MTSSRSRAESFQLNRSVVLVGMMGSGKSAIGRSMADALSVPFLDSDAEIEAAAHATIAEIFERDGEDFFRERETEVIRRLLSGAPCILSTGGGAFLSNRNRDLIDENGVALWLDADLDLLWERVRHKDTRPLLRTENPFQTLSGLFDQRRPLYQKAKLRVDVQHGATIDETTQQAIAVLMKDKTTLEIIS